MKTKTEHAREDEMGRGVVHFRTGGYLNMAASKAGETWESVFSFCGERSRFPNMLTVVEIGDHKGTCKKCIAKVMKVNPSYKHTQGRLR